MTGTPNTETYRYEIEGMGDVFVRIARDPDFGVRIFVSAGKHGGPLNVLADRFGAIIARALRGGVPSNVIAADLVDTRDDRSPRRRNGDPADRWRAYSVPDAIGCALTEWGVP